MDDIILATSSSRAWDVERFLSDFQRSECYWPPLKLESCEGSTFLETDFALDAGGRVRCQLKNVNRDQTVVWRYHDYRSHLDYATKRATLLCSLKKADRMGTDAEMRATAGLAKCREFLRLGYPVGIVRHMCYVVARDSDHLEWLGVRHTLSGSQ